MKTHRLGKWFIAGLAALAAVAVYFQYSQQADDALPEGIASGNGRIEAVQIDVATKIAGRVQDMRVEEGDLVDVGQVLAVIDSAQLRAQLLRAEADVASASSDIASAEATVAQMTAQLELAEKELSRASILIEQNTVSREAYDTSVSQRDIAKANLDAARAALISRQRNRDAADASAQEVQVQLDDSTLVSPAQGRVLYRLVEPGEVLTTGGKVVSLINLADIYMEIFLPSAQAHQVSIGSEARIKLDFLNTAIPAVVSFVSPESQYTPKQVETADERQKLMFRVKVRVPPELVMQHIDEVKTGVRGVAYVRLSGQEDQEWPEFLQVTAPATVATES